MKLTAIRKLTGILELLTGLHIGSSIKGKMRSLLEWELGVVDITEGKPLGFSHIAKLQGAEQAGAKDILRLFGGAPEGNGADETLIKEIGPS